MISPSFPVIFDDPEGKPVSGEAWYVDDATLARLDQCESVGRMYDRNVIEITEGDRLVRAHIYVGRRDHWERHGTFKPCNAKGNGELESPSHPG
jgi:gamma-glutamylcyclotransferase (GGCT)/AIG2-like uncharacterized protein YtfP